MALRFAFTLPGDLLGGDGGGGGVAPVDVEVAGDLLVETGVVGSGLVAVDTVADGLVETTVEGETDG